jgi:hypothetical protein
VRDHSDDDDPDYSAGAAEVTNRVEFGDAAFKRGPAGRARGRQSLDPVSQAARQRGLAPPPLQARPSADELDAVEGQFEELRHNEDDALQRWEDEQIRKGAGGAAAKKAAADKAAAEAREAAQRPMLMGAGMHGAGAGAGLGSVSSAAHLSSSMDAVKRHLADAICGMKEDAGRRAKGTGALRQAVQQAEAGVARLEEALCSASEQVKAVEGDEGGGGWVAAV